MEQPVQGTKPTQPQVTTNPKSINWKKIGLTVLIILVVTGLISGVYWFFILNKNTEVSTDPIVPKPSTQTATESAKESSPSAEKSSSTEDETAGWKTYSDSRLKFQIKHPTSWKATFEDTASASENEPNKTYRTVTLSSGNQSIRILEGGALGFGLESVIKTEALAVSSKNLDFYYYSYSDNQNAYMNKENLGIPGSKEVLGFWIILDEKTISKDLPDIRKILSTFKFLD